VASELQSLKWSVVLELIVHIYSVDMESMNCNWYLSVRCISISNEHLSEYVYFVYFRSQICVISMFICYAFVIIICE
jgi:hypothetical protein